MVDEGEVAGIIPVPRTAEALLSSPVVEMGEVDSAEVTVAVAAAVEAEEVMAAAVAAAEEVVK